MSEVGYTERYESLLLRGDEDPRPWSLIEEISSELRPTDAILDIGCGTGYKTLLLAPMSSYTVGVEPNARMWRRAAVNIRDAGVKNIAIAAGSCQKLPFKDESFDLVCAMVAPHHAEEAARVMRPGGRAIFEKIGDRDKWNIKLEFGSDNLGVRGQFGEHEEGYRLKYFYDEMSSCFSSVDIREGFWRTYYSTQGLRLLLEQTPTVRDFEHERDAHILQSLEKKYRTRRGIQTTQNRILIKARK